MTVPTCACGCGEPLLGRRRGTIYVNRTHGQRAYRRRVGRHPWLDVVLTDPCAYCGAPAEQIDHLHAISEHGTNAIDNLIPACKSCNCAKGATPFLHFLLERTRPRIRYAA
jgi:5-methylcytosine-specific restriction endonuclease McrA